MGISAVFTDHGCYDFFGTRTEVGKQQFEAFRNESKNWYAKLLSKNDPKLVKRLLDEHPETMANLVWDNEKLQAFVNDYLSTKLQSLDTKIQACAKKHGVELR